MKRRIHDDDGNAKDLPGFAISPGARPTSARIEKYILPSDLFLYRYKLRSYPPDVHEHDQLSRFLGALISRLMVATSVRMEPFLCIDGRHLDDDFFARLRENGATWRPLLGFPMIPGLHPFKYLPIAYHIKGREAWDEVSARFLGTGATGIYLTGLAADDFLNRLIQLIFVRDREGATRLFSVFLPGQVLERLQNATAPALKTALDCFHCFVGENPQRNSVDIVSVRELDDLVSGVASTVNP